MATPRPTGRLVQEWLDWLSAHCDSRGHHHLRYQCDKAFWRACHGASTLVDPFRVTNPEPMPPEGQAWHEWVFGLCTVAGHNLHRRNLCAESRQQALRGCVESDRPQDE